MVIKNLYYNIKKFFDEYFDEPIQHIEQKFTEESDITKNVLKKLVNIFIHIMNKSKQVNIVYNNCIPIKNNKIFNMKNKTIENRSFNHYFSYKLNRNYIEKSDKKREFEILLEDYFKYFDEETKEIKMYYEKYKTFK